MKKGNLLKCFGVRVSNNLILRVESRIEVQCLALGSVFHETDDEPTTWVSERNGGDYDDVSCE